MLDTFLKVSFAKEARQQRRNEMAEAMMALPIDELKKIASGQTKLAYLSEKGGGGCWLDQFRGTPLYDQALALEEQELQIEAEDIQQRQEERARRDPIWEQRDSICLEKRLLELKLRQDESGGQVEEPMEEEEPAELEEEAEPEEKAASALDELAKLGHDMRLESMRKMAVSAGWIAKNVRSGMREASPERVGRFADKMVGLAERSRDKADLSRRYLGSALSRATTAATKGDLSKAHDLANYAKRMSKSRDHAFGMADKAIAGVREVGGVLKDRVALSDDALRQGGKLVAGATKKSVSDIAVPLAVAGGATGAAIGGAAALNRRDEKKEKKVSTPESRKMAALNMNLAEAAELPQTPTKAAHMWGQKMAHMEKNAFGAALMGAARAAAPAMKAGLSGAGKGIMQAGKTLKGAHAAGGMSAVGAKIPTIAAGMASKAGQFAQKNPLAAAGLGTGALGGAALGGAALG